MNRIDPTTHERILNSAEKLFGDNGFRGTTLRQITQRARVNLAAVNYHFGTKEALYVEVIRRRIRPLNEARLARLEEAVARAGDQPPPLADILDILIRPVFDVHRDPARGGEHIVRIVSRSLTEPLPFMSELIATEFHPVLARFSQVIRRHAGHLTPEDFMWRLSFVVGAMQHTLATIHEMAALTRGLCRDNDYEGALRRFIVSSVAVFTAPGSRPA
jgi:AcrR family transcriptional regulator